MNLNSLYNKPKWRAVITCVLTIGIAFSTGKLDDWDIHQPGFLSKLLIFLALSVTEGLHLWACQKYENKWTLEIDELERQNNAYKTALSGLIRVCKHNAGGVDSCIESYSTTNQINMNIWNFEKACMDLCIVIFFLARNLAFNDTGKDKCEISYIKLNEENPDEVSMFAYYNSPQSKPNCLNQLRNFKKMDSSRFYFEELFYKNQDEIDVMSGYEKINAAFHRTLEDQKKYPNKYHQYIGVPVFNNNSNMVGLLQIVCTYECTLAEDEATLKEIAEKYFVPYANMFLLLHKMEKALKLGI